MVQFVFYIALLISAISVIFALQNVSEVIVHFLFWQFQGSLAFLLLLSFFLGVLASLLAAVPARFKYSRALAERNNKIKELSDNLIEYKKALNPNRIDG
jgi:uncharacterized integral membrane protein